MGVLQQTNKADPNMVMNENDEMTDYVREVETISKVKYKSR